MRGEYVWATGVTTPNVITSAGRSYLVNCSLRDDPLTMFAGLCQGAPSESITEAQLTEPGIGVNGYSRINIPRSLAGWPGGGQVGTELFLETDWLTFTAVGGNFSQAIQRVAIYLDSSYNASYQVISLGSPLPNPVIITPTTPLAERRFKYRIYI